MLESLFHFLRSLFDPEGLKELIRHGGPLLICAIVFVETGLFVGFFLPGDSLLITAGIFAAAASIPLPTVMLHWLLPVIGCAIIGDQLGYWIGRSAGPALYKREDSFLFRRSHLQRAHDFYEKYGGRAVILARFVPIVRTFCPPVAALPACPRALPNVRHFRRHPLGHRHHPRRLHLAAPFPTSASTSLRHWRSWSSPSCPQSSVSSRAINPPATAARTGKNESSCPALHSVPSSSTSAAYSLKSTSPALSKASPKAYRYAPPNSGPPSRKILAGPIGRKAVSLLTTGISTSPNVLAVH